MISIYTSWIRNYCWRCENSCQLTIVLKVFICSKFSSKWQVGSALLLLNSERCMACASFFPFMIQMLFVYFGTTGCMYYCCVQCHKYIKQEVSPRCEMYGLKFISVSCGTKCSKHILASIYDQSLPSVVVCYWFKAPKATMYLFLTILWENYSLCIVHVVLLSNATDRKSVV